MVFNQTHFLKIIAKSAISDKICYLQFYQKNFHIFHPRIDSSDYEYIVSEEQVLLHIMQVNF